MVKKLDRQLEVAEMRMLRFPLGVTRKVTIGTYILRNEHTTGAQTVNAEMVRSCGTLG